MIEKNHKTACGPVDQFARASYTTVTSRLLPAHKTFQLLEGLILRQAKPAADTFRIEMILPPDIPGTGKGGVAMTKMLRERDYYFSTLQGKPIIDETGRRVGRVKDMTVRWDNVYPKVAGITYDNKKRLIPIERIRSYDEKTVVYAGSFAESQTTASDSKAMFIGQWLLDKQIIDLKGTRLVRVNDILLSWRMRAAPDILLLAVDIGIRGLFRRLGLEFLVKGFKANLLSLQYINPLESWHDNLTLNRKTRELNEWHPAEIADLLEAMDYKSRTHFISILNERQTVAALAQMELDVQVDIIRQMDAGRASDILEVLPPDEAADILGELPDAATEDLLQLMEHAEAEEMRELMQYQEGTAGAMMTTKCISMPSSLTAEQAIAELRRLAPAAETIHYVYISDGQDRLSGVLSLRELIVAQPGIELSQIMHRKVAVVVEDDSRQRVAEVINKYGLVAIPVVDKEGYFLGIVTVDDVLDQLMPGRGKLAGRRMGV